MSLSLNKLLIVWFSHWTNCLLCISQRWSLSCIYHWTTVYFVSQPQNVLLIMHLEAMYLPLNKLFILWLSRSTYCLLCISQQCIHHWTNNFLCGLATAQNFLCGLATAQTVYYVYLAAMYLPLNKLFLVCLSHWTNWNNNCLLCISQRCIYYWTNCLLCGSATEQTVYYVSRNDVSIIEQTVNCVVQPLNKLFIMYLAAMTIIMYLPLNKLFIVWLSHWRNCLLCISQRCIFHWTNCLLCGLATEQTVYYVSRSDVYPPLNKLFIIFWSDVSTIEQIFYFVAQLLNKLFIMYLTAMYLTLNTLFILWLRHWTNFTLCI